jgi:hypothetical protein
MDNLLTLIRIEQARELKIRVGAHRSSCLEKNPTHWKGPR